MENNFTEGKILPKLVKFAMPVFFALILQSMYSAVDLWVVGRWSTAAGVSAVSTGGMIMQTLTSVVASLSMGTTVLIAQKTGAGREKETGRIIGSAICLFMLLSVILSIIVMVFAGGIADIMNAPEEAFEYTKAYIRICGGGLIFIVAYNVLGSIFRGMGDSKVPLFTVAVACAVNIIGDLIFVAGFNMGAAGAAYATVIAQALSVVISIAAIKIKKIVAMTKKDIRFNKGYIKAMLRLGIPIALQDFLVSISFLVIMAIVNSIGVIASAGVGIAERICMFIMLLPSAFMQSMSAFVGQNIGAGKYERAKKTLTTGIAISLCAGTVMCVVTFIFGGKFSEIFTSDTAVIASSFDYLRAYAIDCIFTAFLFCFIGYFNGMGKTKFVMAQGIIGAFCVRVPVSYIMSKIAPVSLFRIGLATPCSTVLQIILCVICFIITDRQYKAKKSL